MFSHIGIETHSGSEVKSEGTKNRLGNDGEEIISIGLRILNISGKWQFLYIPIYTLLC